MDTCIPPHRIDVRLTPRSNSCQIVHSHLHNNKLQDKTAGFSVNEDIDNAINVYMHFVIESTFSSDSHAIRS